MVLGHTKYGSSVTGVYLTLQMSTVKSCGNLIYKKYRLMPNGTHQLHSAIKDASEQVAREGWEDADLRLVMLAGFGYLAHEIRQPIWLRPKLLIPMVTTIATSIGAVLAQVLPRI
jgi:hypothetical protein